MDETIVSSFTRVSPAAFAEKVGIPLGWFVISHRHMPVKSRRRVAHGRWYRISCEGYSIFRILRFSPNLKFSQADENELVVDWVGWLDLHGRADDVDGPLTLKIEPLPLILTPLMTVKHPDPIYRLMGWLALISVGLGLLSIFLSLK
ncbi:MAG TPA: hypothetical protein VG897_08490 [Terriglobales bacterium]|jgi:hypothetical protein|nr:hypothetical protein [Terriglobales bacterium]